MSAAAATRRAASAWLIEHVDLAREAGDGLRAVQDRFGLGVVEVAKLVTDAQRKSGARVRPGTIVQRLLDSDSVGSYPYARPQPYEPDRRAPRLANIGTVKIGRWKIPRLGLGCMRLVSQGGSAGRSTVSALGIPRSPEANRHAVLNAVQVSGVRYLDVARGYGPWPGAGEGLFRDWFWPYPKDLLLASKVGYRRDLKGGWSVDLDPRFLRSELVESHRQFGAPVPLMYLVVRSTPTTPVVHRPRRLLRSLQPLLDAQAEGLIDQIGVANVTLEDLEELLDAGPISVVQNRFSLAALAEPKRRAVLERCGNKKLPFVTWGLFGEGARPAPEPPAAVSQAAEALGVTVGEMTVALMLSVGPHVVPLPGPGKRSTIEACIAGANLRLPRGAAATILEACR